MSLSDELNSLKEQLTKLRNDQNDKSLAEIILSSAGTNKCTTININRIKLKTRCKLRGHIAKVYSLYWTHDPNSYNLLSVSQDSTMILWDTIKGLKLKAIDLSCAWTMTCAIGNSSNGICASAGMDGVVSIYSLVDKHSVDSGKLVRELCGHDGYISAIDFLCERKQLISASADCLCKLWDVTCGVNLCSFKGHTCEIYCMSLNESQCWFATGSADRSVKLWDFRCKCNETCQLTIPDLHQSDVNSIAFFPNGYALASGSDDGTVKLADLRAGQQIMDYGVPRIHIPSVRRNQQSPSIDVEGTTNKSLPDSNVIQTVNNLDSLVTCIGDANDLIPVTSVDFSSSGRLLFCGCDNFDCAVFDTLTGQLVSLLHGHENRIQYISVHRQGRALATASWDSTIRIWN
ncbi:hypothetical protein GJ496_010747 [Pomphorhynchus laevis]|nr:hypothetical protein GJ496_010747 [Pomphorhynchus laevis]